MCVYTEYIHKWRRVAINIACKPYHDHHTSENMAAWVKEIGDEWSVLHILDYLVTDSASNMRAMKKFLPSYIQQTDCTIHVLQLAIMVGDYM